MRRTVLAMAGVIGGMALLSGCGAMMLPLAAVYRDASGSPRALLRPCGDDLIQGLGLTGAPAEDDSDRNRSGWKAPGKRRGSDADFPLFSPPETWQARTAGKQRLVSAYTYELAFGKGEFNYEYTGIVTFRAADLDRLGPGQVWADDRAMSRGEFEKLAADSC
ncbi:hypothetical protein ACFOZ0_19375 [Streptomyces yaanensis]|uniref:Lipoprotein n=1 Tax=Streptomyces yaanensis TaxID=1142239 RepID=A0ABV7SG77_9ACTN|nr:hypothetical protein [Streptomyces sp. CGMCC 4.7035]WNB97982.1 hypothetical protein Q2K21_07725 [Streptomyces sp. CGMCC 4.7035]